MHALLALRTETNMETQSFENRESELIALENEYWRALKERDVDTALSLTGFPCVVTGPQGVRAVDRQTYQTMMEQDPYSIESFDLEDVSVEFPTADVAIVAYRVKQALTVSGQRISLECADASTWIRQGGKWRCWHHSEAILGDPFGREEEEAPKVH